MTAGNRWSGSQPPPPVLSSAINTDRPGGGDPSQQRHHRPLEALIDYPPNDSSGATASSPSYRHTSVTTPARLPLSLSTAQEGTNPGHANLPPLDSAQPYPYRTFADWQLPPFGMRHASDTDRSPVALPPISHPRLGSGGVGDSRSPFGTTEGAISSSFMSRLAGPSGDLQRDHSRLPLDNTGYRAPQSFPTSESLRPDHGFPRPGSSHESNHLGISSLLHDRQGDTERGGVAHLDRRRDPSGHQNVPVSPGLSESVRHPGLVGYDTELKRKRIGEDYSHVNRTRLPSLPRLSASSLPPPPGFAPVHRARSPSPIASPSSHMHYNRDAPRSGFRLVGGETADIDQLEMEVDGADGADYEPGGAGQNKEDARKEKNRDKQRRLRMRRANQLQSLESTVNNQETELKKLSHRLHNVEDRARLTRATFSDWVDALESRLKDLGESETNIETLRSQYVGPINAFNPEFGTASNSTNRGTSNTASSSNRISFSKEMSDSIASTTQYTDHIAPVNTRNLTVPTNIKGNDHSLSPTAIASLVSPTEHAARNFQSETQDDSRLEYDDGTRSLLWGPGHHNPDGWHQSDHHKQVRPASQPYSLGPPPRRARSIDHEDQSRSVKRPQLDERGTGNEIPTFTSEYLARLEEDEVFQMSTSQIGEIKEQYDERRMATLTEHEHEVYNNWVRRPDRDHRIGLLSDPVVRIRFIMLQESRSKGNSIIAFLCDWLHEALVFGPVWLNELCEMPQSFLRRWVDIWPQDIVAKEVIAQMRGRGSYTGARPFEVILGAEPPRARKQADEIDLTELFSTSA